MNLNFLDKKRVRIAHLSDIHIKDDRREEYAKLFKKLHERLGIESPDIIAICGDIFHDKTKASSHNFSDVENFLVELTTIAPVVLIPGNHDLNVKVLGTPDLISPVISNHTILQSPRVYVAHGILWVVVAPDGHHPSLQEVEEVSLRYNLEKTARICLIHETIDGSLLYNGTSLREKRLTPKDLMSYDAVLAGDIHLQQSIELESSSKNSPYYTLPPLIRPVNIPSERGYLKIKLRAGVDITEQPCPINPYYYEIIHDETTTEERLNFHIERLISTYGIPPRAIRLIKEDPNLTSDNVFSTLDQAQTDAQSLEVHEEIIQDILGEKNPYVSQVISLHRKYYINTLSQGRMRARISLLRLQFSNLYCYGSDNLIDFTKLEKGLSGAIAPNRAGKSSLIDIIVFALYDEYPRAERKLNIINKQLDQNYYLLLDFELDGKFGYIEKKGRKSKNRHDAQCKFVYDNRELTQGSNTLTCQEIEKLVGNYSNARITSIYHQGSGTDFIQLKPNERKQILAQILALGSFEKLEKEMREESYKLNAKLGILGDSFQGKEEVEIIKERQVAINNNKETISQVQLVDKKLEAKEKDLRKLIEEKEQVSINLTRIQDKLNILGPECLISLSEAEIELEKILKKVVIDDNSLSSSAVSKEAEVLEVIQQTRRVQKQKREQEPTILTEITQREVKKTQITTQLEILLKSWQEDYSRLKIDIKSMQVEVPAIEKPSGQEPPWPSCQEDSRPTLEEVVFAKNNLASFREGKATARTIILQNLAVVSNSLVIPIQDEKIGEYDSLLALSVKDQQLISDKTTFEANYQSAKLELQTAQSIESSHRPDLLKTARKHPRTAKGLQSLNRLSLQQEVDEAKVKLLAAENAQQIRKQLRLQKGCIGCEYTKSLFTEDKVKSLQKDLEETLLESAALAIYNTYLAKEKVTQLESNLHQIELAQKRYDLAVIQLEKIRDLQKELVIVSQSLAKSQSALTKLNQQEVATLQTENRHVNLRKLGLEKVISAIKNVETAKDAVRTRVERRKLKTELQKITNKLDDCKRKITSLDNELNNLRSQRDQVKNLAASSEAEINRLNERLEEEKKRKISLNEVQEEINLITAYRKILDSKTGIANYLLKRSRSYLEEVVNSVLEECGATFKVYISEEFELNISANYLEVNSEILLSASLGSGYQSFVLSLAFRTALWRLAEVPLPSCQFIDEGFGKCDEENLEAIIQHLVASTSASNAPRLIFIVSHIETLKNAIQ
ncbi:6708_t:CDS:2 [Entrophospora sp. SA101]|nr:7437_t:CDS:2 [Entrophospora sp. SA101]CAJ0824575.1 6708_t:CDS:2 [Entrophospora sp. SA101]